MQKIHRRKNDEITKEFLCTEGCGKAYGSYAALYTHVKNKHANAKLPEMKAGFTKGETTKKTHFPEREPAQLQASSYAADCKICRRTECICHELIDHDELERAINIMADQTYIKFINFVGGLHYSDKQSWIRNNEENFVYFSKQKMREMAYQFNVKYTNVREKQVVLTPKWQEYLSYTSRVIDKDAIVEFYNSLFMILSKENIKDIENVFADLPEFQVTRRCIEVRPKEWNEFMEFIKVI